MNRLLCATWTILCILVLTFQANATTLVEFTDRTDFLSSLAGFQKFTEDFNAVVPQTIPNETTLSLAHFSILGYGDDVIVQTSGSPLNIDGTTFLDASVHRNLNDPMAVVFDFPEPIFGFGADFVEALTGPGILFLDADLEPLMDFYVSGIETPGTTFFGFTIDRPLDRLVIASGIGPSATSIEQFGLDNVVVATVSEVHSLVLGTLGVLVLAILRHCNGRTSIC